MSVASRRERERQKRRQLILEAAKKLFFSRGVDCTRMDEVAAEAELSKGTLYLYFKNKDDLVLALSAEVLDRLIARWRVIAAEDLLGLDRVAKMLRAYADTAISNAEQFRTAAVWMMSGHTVDTSAPCFKAHRQQITQVIGLIQQALIAGMEDGSIRPGLNPIETAGQLWAGVFGVIQVRINFAELNRRIPQPIDPENLVSGFIDIARAGLEARQTEPQTEPQTEVES